MVGAICLCIGGLGGLLGVGTMGLLVYLCFLELVGVLRFVPVARGRNKTGGMMAKEKKAMAKIRVDGVTYEVPKERLELERHLKYGVMLTVQMAKLKAELDVVKAKVLPFGLADMKETGKKSAKLLGAAGLAEVTQSSSLSIAEANVGPILDVLGEEAGAAMIVQKTAYAPSTTMKRLLADGDDPRGVLLRTWVDVKVRESVKFTGK